MDPTLVGDVVLACEKCCRELDYVLCIDYAYNRAYVRDPGEQTFKSWVSGDTWLDALIELTRILKDTLDQQKTP